MPDYRRLVPQAAPISSPLIFFGAMTKPVDAAHNVFARDGEVGMSTPSFYQGIAFEN